MDDAEIRCPARIHGILRDGVFEVKCRSSHCGAGNGVVVLHSFDVLVEEDKIIVPGTYTTRTFRDPKTKFNINQKEAAPSWR
jgi:hypothetical protein